MSALRDPHGYGRLFLIALAVGSLVAGAILFGAAAAASHG